MSSAVQTIFQFSDKQCTIKHLGVILEVKKVNSQTLKVKETIVQSHINEDLLFYDKATDLAKDIKRLFKEMDAFNRHMNDIKKEKESIGFDIGAIGGQENPEEEPEEEE